MRKIDDHKDKTHPCLGIITSDYKILTLTVIILAKGLKTVMTQRTTGPRYSDNKATCSWNNDDNFFEGLSYSTIPYSKGFEELETSSNGHQCPCDVHLLHQGSTFVKQLWFNIQIFNICATLWFKINTTHLMVSTQVCPVHLWEKYKERSCCGLIESGESTSVRPSLSNQWSTKRMRPPRKIMKWLTWWNKSTLYARDKGHHQRVRVPKGAPEVLEVQDHPHAVLKQEEDGEGAGEDNVPGDVPILCLLGVLDCDHK